MNEKDITEMCFSKLRLTVFNNITTIIIANNNYYYSRSLMKQPRCGKNTTSVQTGIS